MEKYTDLKASFSVHEKVRKTVTKIKVTMIVNTPSLPTPPVFQDRPPLPKAEPLSTTEVYHQLLAVGVQMNKAAMLIVKACSDDEAYSSAVLDTIKRCKKHFAKNPGVKSRSGFVFKAIQNDYYQAERIEEEKQAAKIAQAQYEKELEKEIATLVEEGRKEFDARRAPKLQEIKAKYLTDELAQDAIKQYAPGDLVYRKVLDNFLAGKKNKLVEKRIDDYLAKEYLEHDYVNLDRFLAKNYSLEKKDGSYTLSV